MAGRSDAWSWRQAIIESGLMPTTRHVLLTVSCYMNEMGQGAYPTTKQLAAATALSERAVCEHIAKAAGGGFLKISQHGFRGQRWKNHEYVATWPAPKEETGTDPASVPSDEKALTLLPESVRLPGMDHGGEVHHSRGRPHGERHPHLPHRG